MKSYCSKRQLLNSLRWTIYIINSVHNTKLSCYAIPPMHKVIWHVQDPSNPLSQSSKFKFICFLCMSFRGPCQTFCCSFTKTISTFLSEIPSPKKVSSPLLSFFNDFNNNNEKKLFCLFSTIVFVVVVLFVCLRFIYFCGLNSMAS